MIYYITEYQNHTKLVILFRVMQKICYFCKIFVRKKTSDQVAQVLFFVKVSY